MKKLLLILLFLPMIGFGQDKEINWGMNLELAFESASISNKIIMIEFMAEWCPPCKKMEKETFSNAIKKASVVREEIQSFELDQASLFDNTAENRARNKTILWWVLHLSYFLEQDGSHTSIYGEGTYDQRLEKYDELEEDENDFWVTLSKKLIYYISFWYVGRASSEEDFKNLVTEFERSGGVPLDEAAEEMIQEAQEEPEEEPEEVKQVERREEETKKEGE